MGDDRSKKLEAEDEANEEVSRRAFLKGSLATLSAISFAGLAISGCGDDTPEGCSTALDCPDGYSCVDSEQGGICTPPACATCTGGATATSSCTSCTGGSTAVSSCTSCTGGATATTSCTSCTGGSTSSTCSSCASSCHKSCSGTCSGGCKNMTN